MSPKQKQQEEDAVARVLAAVRDKFGKDSITTLSEGSRSEVSEVIPTGINVIDKYVMGCGGLPVGRLTELYSEEAGGKSSLVYQALASAQRSGAVTILAETEASLETSRAKTFGVDLEKLILLQPDTMEDMLSQAEEALNAVGGTESVLFAWDSIAATPTKRELEEGLIGEAKIGERAKMLSKACRILPQLAIKKRTALLFINQVRDNIGVMFGNKYSTPGGHAVKFYASIRIQLFSGKAFKDGTEHKGKDITVLATKNKLSPPFRKAKVRLNYANGWDDQWSTLEYAKEMQLVEDRARGEKAYNEALEKLGWKDKKEDVQG